MDQEQMMMGRDLGTFHFHHVFFQVVWLSTHNIAIKSMLHTQIRCGAETSQIKQNLIGDPRKMLNLGLLPCTMILASTIENRSQIIPGLFGAIPKLLKQSRNKYVFVCFPSCGF